MAYDLSKAFFQSGLEEDELAGYSVGSSGVKTPIQVIVRENFERGSESGKGLSSAIRERRGNGALIITKLTDTPKLAPKDRFFVGTKVFKVLDVLSVRSGIVKSVCSATSLFKGSPAGQSRV